MSGDLVPAMVAAGGGSAMLGGIWLREHRIEEAMRASRVRLSLRFPLGADAAAAKIALSGIASISGSVECVFEVAMTSEGVRHCILVPAAVRESVASVLRAALPGLRLTKTSAPEGTGRSRAESICPDTGRAGDGKPGCDVAGASGAEAGAGRGGHCALECAPRHTGCSALCRADGPRRQRGRAPVAAEVDDTGVRGSRVGAGEGRAGPRVRALSAHVASLIRSRRGSLGALRLTSEHRGRSLGSLPKTTRSSGWRTSRAGRPA